MSKAKKERRKIFIPPPEGCVIGVLIDIQLVKIHKGINNVVNKTKINDIPSNPKNKLKFKFPILNHSIEDVNWNSDAE